MTPSIDAVRVRPEALAQLLGLVKAGTLNLNTAKTVLDVMFANGGSPAPSSRPAAWPKSPTTTGPSGGDQVLAANPKVAGYLAGQENVYQVPDGPGDARHPWRAAPDVVRQLLSAALDAAREEGVSEV